MSDHHDEPCPMCQGAGIHQLKPPNNRFYVIKTFDMKDVQAHPKGYDDLLENHINEWALQGYEVFDIDFNQYSDGHETTIIMKWRWP